MTDNIIFAAQNWVTNAQLIADCHRLGYLKDTDFILDPTYGAGAWWRVWRPDRLYYVDQKAAPWWDFRDMRCWYNLAKPLPDETFDAVAFDPPYVSVGGRSTSGINGMHAAYGMDGAPLSPAGVQEDINLGLNECYRVVRKGGIVLVKCQSYVSSGKLWPGLFHTFNHATQSCGFQVVDHLIHVAGPRPQPEGRGPQKHARRNQSDLLILRRPKR